MAEVIHASDCRGVDVHPAWGRLGDLLSRCHGCGRFVRIGAASEPTEAAEPSPAPRPAPRPPIRREPATTPGALPFIPTAEAPNRNGRKWPTHRWKARRARARAAQRARDTRKARR